MPTFVFAELPSALPGGFAAIALTPEQQAAAIRLSVIVRTPSGAGGPLIVLRELLDARVILGALTDSAGRVHEFVELWIQDASALTRALPSYREAMSNRGLDERWVARAASLEGSAGRFTTGWEANHPEPIFVDLRKLTPVRAVEKQSASPWMLCEDDDLLRRKGRKAYSDSLDRALYAPGAGEKSSFVAISGDGAVDWADLPGALALPGDVICVNPGGLMLVLPLAPVSLEQFVNAMNGDGAEGSVEGLVRTRAAGMPGSNGATRKSAIGSVAGWLGPTSASPARRLPEVLHLKLRLLSEAISLVRSASEHGPMLNVCADSFRVRLVESSAAGLPVWWTARVALVAPGEAVELPIPASASRYFIAGSDRLSIYSPTTLGRSIQSRGVLRIRRVADAAMGSSPHAPNAGTSIEGTLASQERLAVGPNDLLWLRVTVGGVRVDSYALAEPRPPGYSGADLRIRTLPMEFPTATVERLRQAEGVPLPDVLFEVLPLLSTPCDLYSLGVLAVRTLLVNQSTTLPVALDEVLSFAGALAAPSAPGEPVAAPHGTDSVLADAVGKLLAAEPRYLEALGCQRLVSDKVDPAIAGSLIPAKLWNEVLGAIISLFPGIGWFSRCKDFGDAQGAVPYRIYDPVLEGIQTLLARSRSLIVADQSLSREVHEVVRELLLRV